MSNPISILLVDDHPLVRAGLRNVIERDAGFTVCAEAGSVEEGIDLARQLKPDVCVTDIMMPGMSGVELIKRILAIHETCRILAVSVADETLWAERVFAAGAHGYIMKTEPASEILKALTTVAANGTYMGASAQQLLMRKMRAGGAPAAPQESVLTDRELEVLKLIGTGRTLGEIAGILNRSEKTVDTHRQNIKRKLGLNSIASLTAHASRWVIAQDVTPEPPPGADVPADE